MKQSARVMSLLIALSGAVVPAALAQTPPAQTPPAATQTQKAPTLKLAVRQRVPQSEPWAGTRPRARSSEQAIAVARRGERSERKSDTKGTGVRLLNHLTLDVG